MTQLYYIEDALLNNASYHVIRKKAIRVSSLIGIAQGLLLLLAGIFLLGGFLSAVFIIGGLLLGCWGIYRLICKSYHYVYAPTGKQLKRRFYYISAEKRNRLLREFKNINLRDLLDLRTRGYSSLMVDVWHTADGKVFYYQLNEFRNHLICPLTDVRVCEEYQCA